LPIKRSSYKDLRRSGKRHEDNTAVKSELKTLVKKIEKLLNEKKVDAAKSEIDTIVSMFHRAVTKGVLKKNTASRKISRLMKRYSNPGLRPQGITLSQ
jgi:small subunit ribosomal protein S20